VELSSLGFVRVIPEQMAEQLPSQVEVAMAYRRALEAKTGIPDWMTCPWQRPMQFDGRKALGNDDFIQKLVQLPDQLQMRAVEAMWPVGDESEVSPIMMEASLVWSDHFVTIVRQVGLFASPAHVAAETMNAALHCDVRSVGMGFIGSFWDAAEAFGDIAWHERRRYMKQDVPHAMDWIWQRFFQAVRIPCCTDKSCRARRRNNNAVTRMGPVDACVRPFV
jgi:hypothetical protein